jgi:hypothetical protein
MKNSFSSINRLLIGAIVLLTLLSISYSCTKSSTTDPNTSGGTGSKGVTTPGANEVWIQGIALTRQRLQLSRAQLLPGLTKMQLAIVLPVIPVYSIAESLMQVGHSAIRLTLQAHFPIIAKYIP